MTAEPVIRIRALAMRYDGGQEVLDGVDLEVPRGSVYGLLGRNGAGKTTLIRLIMGLYRPTRGEVLVFDTRADRLPTAMRRRIGYLSQDQRMFSWMTLAELVEFTRTFYPAWDDDHCTTLVRNLEVPAHVPLGRLSRGDQQKAGLLLALAPRPDLLVLDEPAANLDTVLRREFLESVLDVLTEQGITVLVSSHILTDVERIADRVGILAEGRLVLSAPLDSLKESVKRLRIVFPGDPPGNVAVPGALRVRRRGRELLVTVSDFTPAVAADLERRFGAGVDVHDVDLEDLFIEYVSGGILP